MFIKNKKRYLISLAVSWVGMIIYYVGAELVKSTDIWFIALFAAIIAGALCGSFDVYLSLVKFVFKKRSKVVILFLPWLIMYFMLKVMLASVILSFGLLFWLAFPGVYALIAWFKHHDELLA